jgi:FMN phosphatase YigB (HAD superfamily)
MSDWRSREPAEQRMSRHMTDVVEFGRAVEAITLDFGNTLVPFPTMLMSGVVEQVAARAADRWACDPAVFAWVWQEERLRQFAQDVPEGREADMDLRAGRVLARLRGATAPPPEVRWNPADVASRSDPAEADEIVDWYATAFVARTPVPPEIGPMLEILAAEYPLAILSNWPSALCVERFVEAAGWAPHFKAVVVSQRVGVIKPRPEIFNAAAKELHVPSGRRLLHVGDDMGADVAGAHGVGWRAAWVRLKPEDSGLPVAPSSGDEMPELTIDRVTDLPRVLGIGGRRVL